MPLKRPSLANSKELFGRVKLRTKFEVSLAEWNPRIDLLALASSEGDVVVKRYLWKTGWKRNFSREHPLNQFETLVDDSSTCSISQIAAESSSSTAVPNAKNAKDELVSLCWSPDGQVLLVAFASGRCLFLDTQSGNTVFARRLGHLPLRISWLAYNGPKKKTPKKRDLPQSFGAGQVRLGDEPTLTRISAADFSQIREDGLKEPAAVVCTSLEQFYRQTLGQSLAGTLLCVCRLEGQQSWVDIFADGGMLLVQRVCVEQTLAACLKRPVFAYQLSTQAVSMRAGKFRIPFTLDEDENQRPPIEKTEPTTVGGQQQKVLELNWPVSRTRLRIYSQIADCVGWISFCCLYLQEVHNYCTGNWKQASEAFHQRVFATAVSTSRSRSATPAAVATTTAVAGAQDSISLQMCRDLLVVCAEGEASDLLEKFLAMATTEKGLKQAASFVNDLMTLIKGISVGLLPATRSLRHSICALRAHLSSLCMNIAEEDASVEPAQLLLDTLLKIATGHPAFPSSPVQRNLSQQQCAQFLDDFELSALLLEQKLGTVLALADMNRVELSQLLHWLVALIFESGNECNSVIDDASFDVKLLNGFLTEVVNLGGFSHADDGGKHILDRVYPHLIGPEAGEAAAELMIRTTEQDNTMERQPKDPEQSTAAADDVPMEQQPEEPMDISSFSPAGANVEGKGNNNDDGGEDNNEMKAEMAEEEEKQKQLPENSENETQQPSSATSQKQQQSPPPPPATEFASSSFVAPHLVARLADPGQQQLKSSTIWQLLQWDCFRHLRALFQDGITKLVHSPVPLDKCRVLFETSAAPAAAADSGQLLLQTADLQQTAAAAQSSQEEEQEEVVDDDEEETVLSDDDEEEEVEEMLSEDGGQAMEVAEEARQSSGRSRNRKSRNEKSQSGRGMDATGAEADMDRRRREELTLHAFIFGYDHQQQQGSNNANAAAAATDVT